MLVIKYHSSFFRDKIHITQSLTSAKLFETLNEAENFINGIPEIDIKFVKIVEVETRTIAKKIIKEIKTFQI